MALDLLMGFVLTMTNPLVWLAAAVLLVAVPRPVAVRAAVAALAACLSFLEPVSAGGAVERGALTIVSAATGLAVAEIMLVLVLPVLLAALAVTLRCLLFVKRLPERARRLLGGPERDTPPAPSSAGEEGS